MNFAERKSLQGSFVHHHSQIGKRSKFGPREFGQPFLANAAKEAQCLERRSSPTLANCDK